MEKKIMDIVIFKLKENETGSKSLLIGKWDTFLEQNPGFISRRLLQSANEADKVIDIIEWRSAEDANNAFEQMKSNPDFAKINSIIDSIVLTERCAPFQFKQVHL